MKKKKNEYGYSDSEYQSIGNIIEDGMEKRKSPGQKRTWKTLWLKNQIELLTAIVGLITALLTLVGLMPNAQGQPQFCNLGICGNSLTIYATQADDDRLCNDGTVYDNFNQPCQHDEDADGIHDDVDACPNLGDMGYGITNRGCPHDTEIEATVPPTSVVISTATPAAESLPASMCIAINGAWLRAEPDADSQEILATLALGQQVILSGRIQDESGTSNGTEYFQWWHEITANSQTGWIEESLLTNCVISVNTDSDPDRDGFLSSVDLCPSTYGTLNGCPDSDSDGIRDSQDQCPYEYGLASNNGCPEEVVNDRCSDGTAYDSYNEACNHDEDSDGVLDVNDYCPSTYGTINGCPDSDGDGVIDSQDDCPSTYGTINGCPDSDADGVIDSQDDCPYQYGPASNNGCPQTTITEDCIAFNPNSLAVENINGNWTIVENGNHYMMSFGSSQTEANTAFSIIQYYGMNDTCYVGRPGPSLTYLLVNNSAPSGAYSGEDCIYFNANNIEVTYVSGRWKIVEGSHWILDFDQNESEARLSHAIMQHYSFSYICYVGRPGPSLTYLRR